MNNRWFKEDRELPKSEQAVALETSKEIIKNSTLVLERLERILREEIEHSYREEEDVESPNYPIRVAYTAGERKTLRKILELINIG